jgi:REP element-mobilizing transposase RayT
MIAKSDSTRTRRGSIRLKDYDYSQAGGYFVTLVTHQRRCVFGEVVDGNVQLSAAGRVVNEIWRGLSKWFANASADLFVVMPNHVHVIVAVGARFIAPDEPSDRQAGSINYAPTLGQIIRTVKAASTHRIRQTSQLEMVWQRNYYDHVIRDEESLNRIRQYLLDNPIRWASDPENPQAAAPERADIWRVR